MKCSMFLAVVVLSIFICACTNENNETKFPLNTLIPCDQISYKTHIKPVIETSCATTNLCHASGALYDFSNYDSTFSHLPKFYHRMYLDTITPMPPVSDPPLSKEQLRQFKCWLDAGYKNN